MTLYHNPSYPWLKYTSPVKQFADEVGAYWLIDWFGKELQPLSTLEPFLVIEFRVRDNEGWLSVTPSKDLGCKFLKTRMPEGSYKFHLNVGVLKLVGEL